MKKITLYFMDGVLVLGSIELNGTQHFTADIRTFNYQYIELVTSFKTQSDKMFNQQEVDACVHKGIYTAEELMIEPIIEKDERLSYTYIQINRKFIKTPIPLR